MATEEWLPYGCSFRLCGLRCREVYPRGALSEVLGGRSLATRTCSRCLPPVAPRPVLDVAALQGKCETWGQKAPRHAREFYAPDLKGEPAWIGNARELDHDITRSFESLKGNVDDKVHTFLLRL